MPLFLLDRDGVLVVNRPDNIKVPDDLQLIPGSTEAIARLNSAGYVVGMCTNQCEVGRGTVSAGQLQEVHEALQSMLKREGASIDVLLCCTTSMKSPRRKPSGGMLREAIRRFGADPTQTPFVGDQPDDLKAAFHARCRRILVKTGLGRKSLEAGLPTYVAPVEVFEDLSAAVTAELARQQPSP
jgi:D-glycero-D-manno-heptose 1,7-bisphosphate phosphatase